MDSADKGTDRIVAIELDEHTVVRRSPEVEHERAVALYDLLDMNRFRPLGDFTGPYKLKLSIEERSRLVFDVMDEEGGPLTRIMLPLTPFRSIVRDYFQICESYFEAVKKLPPSQIETIDMARRGIHNEGSRVLQERLSGKAEIDTDTARRLFTLICVLHFGG